MSWIYIRCPTLTIIGGISAFFVGYPIVSTIATIAVSIYKKLKYRYGRCRCIDSDRKLKYKRNEAISSIFDSVDNISGSIDEITALIDSITNRLSITTGVWNGERDDER